MKISRRSFVSSAIGAGVLAGTTNLAFAQQEKIAGFDDTKTDIDKSKTWQPISDRKIKMGLVGFGLCQFSAAFGLQNHPNVEVVAVSDLIPERCAALSETVKCPKTYPSLEEMVKDKEIEAIFVATDAPSHAKHCINVLNHGKHVATAVPAMYGNLEEADQLFETVKKSGLNYMMFETSVFHDNCYAMRTIYNAGGFGKLVFSEGEYFHYFCTPLDSYNGWRIGLPPQFYPTHSNAYYIGVTGKSFTEVSCMGFRSNIEAFDPKNNRYANPFSSEIALFRTSEGGSARMAVAWDTPGIGAENGRVHGEKGSFINEFAGLTEATNLVAQLNLKKPPLPPTVDPGGHGGSHGYLGNEFVESILLNRKPLVDIATALNMSVPGTIAHFSALKDGELMKIPQYAF
ncbi:MAG: Gfo/Idh/MocA family protein [Thermoguttaceae bacterium]